MYLQPGVCLLQKTATRKRMIIMKLFDENISAAKRERIDTIYIVTRA